MSYYSLEMDLVPTEIFFISDHHYHNPSMAQSLVAYKDPYGGHFEKWDLFLMKLELCMKFEMVYIILRILFQMLQIFAIFQVASQIIVWTGSWFLA